MMNINVRSSVYERFSQVIHNRPHLLVADSIQREGRVGNLLAEWAAGL